jgi:hypothetical protein
MSCQKVKISVPLLELMKIPVHKGEVEKVFGH